MSIKELWYENNSLQEINDIKDNMLKAFAKKLKILKVKMDLLIFSMKMNLSNNRSGRIKLELKFTSSKTMIIESSIEFSKINS